MNPNQDPEADAGHQAFIDTLVRVQTELRSNTATSGSSLPTTDVDAIGLQSLSLDRIQSESPDKTSPESSPKVLGKEKSFVSQDMKDDKVQARFALQALFSTLKSLEKEVVSLWDAFHNDRSETLLVTAATTTHMAMKLVTALEMQFDALYKNCNLSLLAQELHVQACEEKGQPNLHGFLIDFAHYTTAETYYIPHLWMASHLQSNWEQVVQDVQSKKAISRRFDNDKRKMIAGLESRPVNDGDKEDKRQCEESLTFGFRTVHRVLSGLSKARTFAKSERKFLSGDNATARLITSELYPGGMDPLIQNSDDC